MTAYKTLFRGEYSLEDIIRELEELNEILCDLENFGYDETLFYLEIYPRTNTVNILFNGEYVVGTEDTGSWKYDYNNRKWSISLQEHLKQWLLKKKEMYSKINFDDN